MMTDPLLLLASLCCLWVAATDRLHTGFLGTAALVSMSIIFALALDDSLYESVERIYGMFVALALCVLAMGAQVLLMAGKSLHVPSNKHRRCTDWHERAKDPAP